MQGFFFCKLSSVEQFSACYPLGLTQPCLVKEQIDPVYSLPTFCEHWLSSDGIIHAAKDTEISTLACPEQITVQLMRQGLDVQKKPQSQPET